MYNLSMRTAPSVELYQNPFNVVGKTVAVARDTAVSIFETIKNVGGYVFDKITPGTTEKTQTLGKTIKRELLGAIAPRRHVVKSKDDTSFSSFVEKYS